MIINGVQRWNSCLINKLRYSTMISTIVEISEGKLQGKICKTANNVEYLAFKSIPYAKPPIGDLRFAAPQPAEKWKSIRDATQDCESSMQYDTRTKTIKGSEDCLYLNVFTPKTPKDSSKPLPVMFYIHGGGFTTGNGTKEHDQQGPDYILEKYIVYVGINYRLGLFGFFSLNRKEAAGNMGLKDQVHALKWVQKNINKFNGDPDNVTVFGISAGGASVEYLPLSRMANGLFHKAISQSGSTLLHWGFNTKIETLAAKIPGIDGKTVNNADELYEYLKNVDGEKLMASAMSVKPDKIKGGIRIGYFLPTVEKPNGDWEPFLDEIPYKLLKEGNFLKVPFISGYCSREGLILLNVPNAFKKLMETGNFFEYLPYEINDKEKDNINEILRKLYIGDGNLEHKDDFAIDFFTDLDFLGGIYVSASLIAKESPCYFYEFDYSGGYNYMKSKLQIDRKGACHADDKGYILKCSLTKSTSDTDEIVRDRFVKMWTDFAKFGNPTPDTNIWKPASLGAESNEDISYLRIDDKLKMCNNMKTERMKFFTELYNKYKFCKYVE